MQISMKCSVAIHCLLFINEANQKIKVTSSLLAESTGSNPVIIRNILSSLKKANIINIKQGTGGATLSKDISEINLYMIYHAVEPNGLHSLIGIHSCEDRICPIAKSIKKVLAPAYKEVANSVKQSMMNISLDSFVSKYHQTISEIK